MKQFYLLASALMISLVGSAQIPQLNTDRGYINHKAETNAVISRSNEITDIITNPPGTAKSYLRASTGIFLQWGTNFIEYTEEGTTVEVVFGEDNDVYLKNIMSYGATGSYVKGTIDGDKITVDLPQTVLYDDFAGDYVNLVKLMPVDVGDGGFTYGVDPEGTSYTYTLKEDGSFVMDDLGWMNAIGFAFASTDTWAGYLDFTQTFTPFAGELVAGPEDMPLQNWVCTTPATAFTITVAMDENDFFVKGLCPETFPDSWVKGRVEGDKVYMPFGQYMGIYADIYPIYMMFGRTFANEQVLDPEDTEFVFNIDEDGKTLTPADEEMQIFFNAYWNRVLYIEYLDFPVLKSQESYAGVPADPYDLVLDTSNRPYYGYSAFRFYVPVKSVEGNVLDANKLYYNVFVGGELLVIDKDVYIDITENMTDIPYYFSNSYDVWDRGYGLHSIGIYPAEVSTLGVQSVYKYEGEVTKSNLVELKLQTSGLEDVDAEKTIAESELFDLAGRRVDNPVPGSILIRRTVYTDGTIRTDKVVRK